MRLQDRRILVTGAASGIGRAIAARFMREGARVAMVDRNRTLLDEAGTMPRSSFAIIADVSHADEVGDAVSVACAQFGGLDGVVNCAGIDLMRPFSETTLEDW
jgi:NAD(P)-dependent dehydrogenase (short-subunit alcohol dehydrogenase family)